MTVYEFCVSYWWIFPIMMIILCFFMMKGRGCSTCCCFGSTDRHKLSESSRDTADKRYAQGEINQQEYEEKKWDLS